MGSPIDRTAKTALDSNLANGNISDAPKIKANNDVVYNYVDGLNSAIDTAAAATTLPHADSSVTGPKIRDGAVTTAKIADGAVTPVKIPDGVLTAAKFVPGALQNETQNGLEIVALKAEKANQTDVDALQEDTTAQLALKSDITYTDAELALKRDTAVKLNNSDLDTSTDANKIKLVNLSNEVVSAMAGTTAINASVANGAITREKFADASYTRNMTKFYTSATSNLYDKTYNTPGYYNYTTGAFISSASHYTTDYIPVLPGENYIQKASTFINFYNVSKEWVSGVFLSSWTIPSGTGIVFMRCTVDIANVNTNIINTGSTLQAYTDYKVTDEKLLIKTSNLAGDLLIPESNLDEISPSKVNAFVRGSVNLFDKKEATPGYPSLTTGIQNSDPSYRTSDYIEISPSTTYTHNGYTSAFKVFYDASHVFISGISSVPPFTTPSGAYYVKVVCAVPGGGDIQTQLDQFMTVLGDTLPVTYAPFDLYTLDETIITSRWHNTIWNVLGDSITYGYRTTKTYWQYINDEKHFSNIRNYGISGSTIAKTPSRSDEMSTRYVNMNDQADLITVFGGTNDFSYSIPIGSIGDTTNTTFYGALKILIEGLINKYPDKPIVFITPLHRGGTPIEGSRENEANTAGRVLVDYVNAIKEICPTYSIPVIDLWSTGGMQPNIQAQHDLYFPEDGLHPNAAGHEVMGRKIGAFLESI